MQLFTALLALVAAFSAYIQHQTTDLVVAFRERAFQPVFHNFLAIEPSTVTSTITASPTVAFTTTIYHGGSMVVVATSAPSTPPSTTVSQAQYCLAPLAWADLQDHSICISEHAFERLSAFLATLSEAPTLDLPRSILVRLSAYFSLLWELIWIPTTMTLQWISEISLVVARYANSVGWKFIVAASAVSCSMRDFLATFTLADWLTYSFLLVIGIFLLIGASIPIIRANRRCQELLSRLAREEAKAIHDRRWKTIAKAIEYYENPPDMTKEEARETLVAYLTGFITDEKHPQYPPPTIRQRCPEVRITTALWALACGFYQKLLPALKWTFDVQFLFLVKMPLTWSWQVINSTLGRGICWLCDTYLDKLVFGIMPFCLLMMVNFLFSLLGLSMIVGILYLWAVLVVLICCLCAIGYVMIPAVGHAGRMGAQVVAYLRESAAEIRERYNQEDFGTRPRQHGHTSTSLAQRSANHRLRSDPSVTTLVISHERLQSLLSLEAEHSTILHILHNVSGRSVLSKIESLLCELRNPFRTMGSKQPDENDDRRSKDTATKAHESEKDVAEKQQLKTRIHVLEDQLVHKHEHDLAEKKQLKTRIHELETALGRQHEQHDLAEKKQLEARVQELESSLRSQREQHEEEAKKLRQEAEANAKRVEAKVQELEQVQARLSQTERDNSKEAVNSDQLQAMVDERLAAAVAEKTAAIRGEYEAHIDVLMTAGRQLEASAEASRGQHQAEVEQLKTVGRQVEAEAESLRGMLQSEQSSHAASKVQLEQAKQALLGQRQLPPFQPFQDRATAVQQPGPLPSNPSGNSSGAGFNQPATTVPSSTSAPPTTCGDLEALRTLRAAAAWHNQQQRARAGAMQSSAQPPVQTATRATQPAAYVTSDVTSSHANQISIVAGRSTAPAGLQCSEVSKAENTNFISPKFIPNPNVAISSTAPAPITTTAALPPLLPSPTPTMPVYLRSTSQAATPANHDGSETDPLRRQMMAVVTKAPPPPQEESDSDFEVDFEDVNLEPAAHGDSGVDAEVASDPVDDRTGTQRVTSAFEGIELKSKSSKRVAEVEARRKADEIEPQRWKEEQAELQREREARGEIFAV
jgi:hypothetical protein